MSICNSYSKNGKNYIKLWINLFIILKLSYVIDATSINAILCKDMLAYLTLLFYVIRSTSICIFFLATVKILFFLISIFPACFIVNPFLVTGLIYPVSLMKEAFSWIRWVCLNETRTNASEGEVSFIPGCCLHFFFLNQIIQP